MLIVLNSLGLGLRGLRFLESPTWLDLLAVDLRGCHVGKVRVTKIMLDNVTLAWHELQLRNLHDRLLIAFRVAFRCICGCISHSMCVGCGLRWGVGMLGPYRTPSATSFESNGCHISFHRGGGFVRSIFNQVSLIKHTETRQPQCAYILFL